MNDVLSSTYTTAVHPITAHSGYLAPIRVLYTLLGLRNVLDKLSTFVSGNAELFSAGLPSGPTHVA